VSTDDPQIAAFANQGGVPAPFLRPAGLAADDTPMLPVVRHALKWLQDQEGYLAEVVVLLQPTSPLRRAEHIDAAVETLLQTGADTVVSVIPVPHQFNPVSVMSLEEGVLTPYLPGPLILSRQEKPRLFARNGPAVLAVRRQTLESGTLYGPRTSPFLMLPADSVDIDDPEDLSLAEFYLSRRARQNTADKS
jgi:CMP-N-acetylneuraminic acid synthetase